MSFWFPRLTADRALRLAREGGWIVFGQIVAAVGSLVLVRVVTGYLEPAEYGQLSLALTLGTLVCQVAMSGLTLGITRFFPVAREKGEVSNYLKASVTLLGYGTLGTAGLTIALLAGIWAFASAEWIVPTALATLVVLVITYNSTLSGIQNAARQRQIVALHSGADPWLRIVAVVAAFALIGHSASATILGYALAALLVLVSQVFFARRLVPNVADSAGGETVRSWLHSIWTFSQPFMIFNIFTWAQTSSDRWALQALATTHDVGVYSALMQVGFTPIAIAIGLLTTFVAPILNQRSGDATDVGRNANVHRISWMLAGFSLIVTLVAFLLGLAFHGIVFAILVAPPYRSISYLLPWVLLAGGLVATGQVLALKLMSEMNSQALLVPKLVMSVIGVAFSLLGAKIAGVDGIAAASIFFALVQLIWLALLTAEAPKANPLDTTTSANAGESP